LQLWASESASSRSHSGDSYTSQPRDGFALYRSSDDGDDYDVAVQAGESSDDSEEEAAVAAPGFPAPQAIAAGGAAVPIDTGAHTLRKVPMPPVELTDTVKEFGSLVYEYLGNTGGDAFIAAVKRPTFNPAGGKRRGDAAREPGITSTLLLISRVIYSRASDLPDTAATLKAAIVKGVESGPT